MEMQRFGANWGVWGVWGRLPRPVGIGEVWYEQMFRLLDSVEAAQNEEWTESGRFTWREEAVRR